MTEEKKKTEKLKFRDLLPALEGEAPKSETREDAPTPVVPLPSPDALAAAAGLSKKEEAPPAVPETRSWMDEPPYVSKPVALPPPSGSGTAWMDETPHPAPAHLPHVPTPGMGTPTPRPIPSGEALDSEIDRLLKRTEPMVQGVKAPPIPAKPKAPPEFSLPPEQPPEEGVDRGKVLDAIERVTREAAMTAPSPGAAPVKKKETTRTARPVPRPDSSLQPAGVIALPTSSTASPFDFEIPPRVKAPGRVRETVRRVRDAITPLVSSAIDPAAPWLSLGIVMIGILWIAMGAAVGQKGWIVVGLFFIAPVVIAEIFARRNA